MTMPASPTSTKSGASPRGRTDRIIPVWDCIEHEMAAKAENKSYRRIAWQEARDGGADDGVRAKDHLLYSVKSRRSKRVQVESFPAWAVKPLLGPRLRHARGSS